MSNLFDSPATNVDDEPAIAVDDPEILIDDDPLGGALDATAAVATSVTEPVTAVSASPAVAPAPLVLVATPLAELLPVDFPLPTLIKFVPDTTLKVELDAAVRYANSLQISHGGQPAIATGDAAVTAVKNVIKAIEAHFDEPCAIANRLHKQLTEKRAEWTADGVATAKLVGRRVAEETLRLEEAAREERRRQQAEADRQAKAEADREAEAAKAAGAPEAVVEQLQQQAQTAVAPPVMVAPVAAPRSNTVTQTWKARIKGTPADADPNPTITDLTPVQRPQINALLKAILDGKESIALIDLNWSAINARAKSDKGAFNITGLEAFTDTGLRAKPGFRR